MSIIDKPHTFFILIFWNEISPSALNDYFSLVWYQWLTSGVASKISLRIIFWYYYIYYSIHPILEAHTMASNHLGSNWVSNEKGPIHANSPYRDSDCSLFLSLFGISRNFQHVAKFTISRNTEFRLFRRYEIGLIQNYVKHEMEKSISRTKLTMNPLHWINKD